MAPETNSGSVLGVAADSERNLLVQAAQVAELIIRELWGGLGGLGPVL